MANEGSITITLSITKGDYADSRSATERFDVTGTHSSSGVQTIGTSQEPVEISADVATLGYGMFRNISTANYIELGVVENSVFRPFAKLQPGHLAALPLGMAYDELYAKADTAACDLEFRVYEV